MTVVVTVLDGFPCTNVPNQYLYIESPSSREDSNKSGDLGNKIYMFFLITQTVDTDSLGMCG